MDYLTGSGDRDVDVFVDANLTSFAAWDVAVYLDHTDGVSSCVQDFVDRLGRKENEVVPVLRDLVERGIAVQSTESDGVVRYALSADPAIRLTVARFVEVVKVREVRLDFVRRVLARMSRG